MMTDCSSRRKLFAMTMPSWISTGSTRPRGLTSKTYEAQHTFSHQHDSGSPYNKRDTQSGEPSCTPNSEPAWKVLLLSCWLLMGRPAEHAFDVNCASFLEARLDLFWSEDWPALWALVRADCDVASVVQALSKTQAEQTEARVRKVATLARAGEKERALAAARNAPPVPVTRDVVQEITSLYPVDPDPALPLTNHISHIFIFQIAELTTLTLKRMPRLSEAGPLGMGAEPACTMTVHMHTPTPTAESTRGARWRVAAAAEPISRAILSETRS